MARNNWGIPVELLVKTQTGEGDYGEPIYDTAWVTVDNVLVGQPEPDEVLNEYNLTGRRIRYTLGIPKGDTHEWENTSVRFFGKTFMTTGAAVEGIEKLIPTAWHKKIGVIRYEQEDIHS